MILLFVSFVWAASDPRMEIESVKKCVDTVKGYLRSDEFSSDAGELQIVSACRHADAACVSEAGEALTSFERGKAEKFLPLVRACGEGVAPCLKAQVARASSFDRNEAHEIEGMLKKCE